jgi:hypothetical protein
MFINYSFMHTYNNLLLTNNFYWMTKNQLPYKNKNYGYTNYSLCPTNHFR